MTEPSEITSKMHISTIEWDMMDKTKFLPLSMLSSFCVRCTLYPLTLIKTRLQIQKHGEMYKGILTEKRLFYNKIVIIRNDNVSNKLIVSDSYLISPSYN